MWHPGWPHSPFFIKCHSLTSGTGLLLLLLSRKISTTQTQQRVWKHPQEDSTPTPETCENYNSEAPRPTHTCQVGSLLSLSCKFLPPNTEYCRDEEERHFGEEFRQRWMDLVTLACNPRIWEAEDGEVPQIQSQFVLCSKFWAPP